ncbi:MAG: hypothetical protein KJ847_03380 [Firmicutes bacterium]|nr:hypothetical protein [Bacillota bacterium]
MGLFNKRKKVEIVEEVDFRTDIERKFEETGQKVGKQTGVFVQKSVDKINEVKEKVNADEKMEKVKEFASKAEQSVDEFVGKATTKTKETFDKVKGKVSKEKK